MKFGLASWAYPWALGHQGRVVPPVLDVHGLLRRTRELDLGLLQLADNVPLLEAPDAELRALRAAADALGVALEYGERGLTEARVARGLEVAVILGSPFLRLVIDRGADEPEPSEIVRRLDAVVPLCRQRGVILALENHDRLASAEMAALVSRHPEWLAICLDTTNSLGAGEGIDEVLRHLAPYTINLHCKDVTIRRYSHGLGFEIQGCPAGSGDIPFDRIVRDLRRHGRCRSAVLEQWTMPQADAAALVELEADSVRRGVSALRGLFGRV